MLQKAFNQEKALVGAFSVIVQLRRLIACSTRRHPLHLTLAVCVIFSSYSPSSPGDRVTLLLWYKETTAAVGAELGAGRAGGMGSPIYRIDARTNNKDIAIGEMIINFISLDSDCYIL